MESFRRATGFARRPRRRYAQRTVWNVRDSDATVIFSQSHRLFGGSVGERSTRAGISENLFSTSPATSSPVSESVPLFAQSFLRQHHVRLLNVAGPRRSQESREPAGSPDLFSMRLSGLR